VLNNIALVCLTNIGDGVLLSPCLAALAERSPKLNIVLVAKPSVCELYGRDNRIKTFVPFTCSWFPGPNGRHDGLKGFYRTVQTLRALQCRVALNTASDLRTNLLLRLAGVTRLISSYGRGGNFLSNSLVGAELVRQHEAERQLQLAAAFLNEELGHYQLRIVPGDEDVRAAKLLFAECVTEEGAVVAIHPGANVHFKEWPLDRYIEVAHRIIRAHACTIAVLGAPGRESDIAARVTTAIGARAVNLGGRTPVRILMPFLSQCAIYIGNDSGPMHLAAAAGCPTVALFGATNHYRFGPYLPDSMKRIIVSRKFQIDTVAQARTVGAEYMAEINEDEVLAAACELMQLNAINFAI